MKSKAAWSHLSGCVSTLVGDGTAGFKDGPIATARFDLPYHIVVDGTGGLVVTDRGNQKIRRIVGGQVSTIAGNGQAGFADGPAAQAMFKVVIYVADSYNHTIRKIENGQVSTIAGTGTKGFADGPVLTAMFDLPYDIAVGGVGQLYVADATNQRLRVIENGKVRTLAGTGSVGLADGSGASATFHDPHGLAIGSHGEVYVTDYRNHAIRVYWP
ncbi:MAG: hypothetical protein KAI47_10850 [Deltaproteobacteria bacterium]|nr:hypothetical protein [Deltaproteobacteria bacterium]